MEESGKVWKSRNPRLCLDEVEVLPLSTYVWDFPDHMERVEDGESGMWPNSRRSKVLTKTTLFCLCHCSQLCFCMVCTGTIQTSRLCWDSVLGCQFCTTSCNGGSSKAGPKNMDGMNDRRTHRFPCYVPSWTSTSVLLIWAASVVLFCQIPCLVATCLVDDSWFSARWTFHVNHLEAMGATLAAHCCASEEEDQPAMKGLKKDWMIGHDEARACTVIIMQLLKMIKMGIIKILMFQFYPHLWLIFWEDVAFVSIPLDGKHMVDNLQGHWYRQGDAKHVGRNSDGGRTTFFFFRVFIIDLLKGDAWPIVINFVEMSLIHNISYLCSMKMTFLVDYKLTSYLPHDWLWDISGHGTFSCRRLGKRITRVWQTEHVNCVVPAKTSLLLTILNDIKCNYNFFWVDFNTPYASDGSSRPSWHPLLFAGLTFHGTWQGRSMDLTCSGTRSGAYAMLRHSSMKAIRASGIIYRVEGEGVPLRWPNSWVVKIEKTWVKKGEGREKHIWTYCILIFGVTIPPKACRLTGQSGLLEVKMEDETRYATVTLSPAAIMWADGDIWVQKLDSPKKTAMKKQGHLADGSHITGIFYCIGYQYYG